LVAFFAVGLVAQLIDGALGMAFGLTATTFMLSFGVSPVQASAMVHIAEIFTTAASGASHFANRNIDWTIVRRIAIPGTVGGVLGATVLVNIDGKVIAPFVAAYPHRPGRNSGGCRSWGLLAAYWMPSAADGGPSSPAR
jgi:uncharacterized membrane protein YfcA